MDGKEAAEERACKGLFVTGRFTLAVDGKGRLETLLGL